MKKVTITLEFWPDGVLRVYSAELPGLLLSGIHHDKVMADILPAILTIQEYNEASPLPQPQRTE